MWQLHLMILFYSYSCRNILGGRSRLHNTKNFDHFYNWSEKIFLPGVYNGLEAEYLNSLHSLRLQDPMIIQTRKNSKHLNGIDFCFNAQ